ncbi:MAG: hypothetical protein L7F78_09350 [Syntrophales bacterium LBB04]|nr:hypothetical protein [Syntrophales bacterium LBB04]
MRTHRTRSVVNVGPANSAILRWLSVEEDADVSATVGQIHDLLKRAIIPDYSI